MTLEEGIRILKNEKNETFSPYQVLEARDTLINYIENESISTKKVRKMIADLEVYRDIAIDEHNKIASDLYRGQIKALRKLLGE